jgi:lipopolysaccharide biosynthesis regulator YciM
MQISEKSLANLKPYTSENPLSSEQAKIRGSAGGKKAAESKKRKKQLKEAYEELAGMKVSDDIAEKLLTALGQKKKKALDVPEAIMLAQIVEALNGNSKAATFIRDTIGEKPIEKVAMAEIDPSVITEVESLIYDTE